MGYVADFITGRSIAQGDRVVGLVIVPQMRGWPDPVRAAATDPTHPHDGFSPLSLPLQGFINDRGYFEPEKTQLGLSLLLETAGFESWEKFFDQGFDFRDEEGGFTLDGKLVLAGISAMHVGTYEALCALGTYERNRESRAAAAANIIIDAQTRFQKHRDDRSYFVSIFHSAPYDDDYTTLSGDVITVPECSQALSDGHTWQVDRNLRRQIAKRYSSAYLGDGRELTELFEQLSGFQKLCVGMHYAGKYFTPGGFMRHDNLYDATKVQIASLMSTFENSASRRGTGYEWTDEQFIDDMEEVAERLRQLHATVEDEISKAKAYFASEELEADEDESPEIAPR